MIRSILGRQHDSEHRAGGFALPWAFLVGRQSGRTQEDDAKPAPSRASSHLPENPPVGSHHVVGSNHVVGRVIGRLGDTESPQQESRHRAIPKGSIVSVLAWLAIVDDGGDEMAIKGIRFAINAQGEKQAVLIDLKHHRELWEDLFDTLLARERADEPRETLDEVRGRLGQRHG